VWPNQTLTYKAYRNLALALEVEESALQPALPPAGTLADPSPTPIRMQPRPQMSGEVGVVMPILAKN
jgi:hypothetical protein